jgi:Asp-tRNA(Asn)/Glu-tRNA(Gln) amidotransferase A subunit family amidase
MTHSIHASSRAAGDLGRATDLCYLTATEAVQHFRDGSLSPMELLQAVRDRVERHAPPLNPFRALRWEAAEAAARASEARYRRGEANGALDGVPTLLKNEHHLIGEETDVGSLLLAGRRDTGNAPITQRLLDAGAVIHARTHVPEFCVAQFTSSVAHGTTRNPWNYDITCGGSSGGSAAALAAGMGMVSSASDIGGSIRMPAAYCGVVGFKPSYGRVPEADIFYALNTFNHNGLLCRSVEDAARVFNVISGPHRADPTTLRPKLELPAPVPDVRGMRIALSLDLGYFEVSEETRQQTLAVAQHLRDAGAVVEEVPLPWTARAGDAFTDALVFALGHGLADLIAAHPEVRVSDYVRDIAEMGRRIPVRAYLDATNTLGDMHAALQDVFEQHDALVCPTLTHNDMPAEGVPDSHNHLLRHAMTYPFNMLSRHPVLAVPSGRGANGVPLGVQIVGQTFCEDSVMRIGAVLQACVGWRHWRPALRTVG